MDQAQSNELTIEFTSVQERCMSQIWFGLATSLAYPGGEKRGNFLVQITFTCRRYMYRKGGGVGTLWDQVKGKKVRSQLQKW